MKQTTYDFATIDFSRIAVIGCAGSGKTTFSKSIGSLLGREVTHLDKILWGENWTKIPVERQLEILQPIVESPSWIIDGMWANTLELKYQRATLVIFLDYKPSLCVWRAFWRTVKSGGKQRDDLATGCVEKIDLDFYKYIANFNKNVRPKIDKAQADFPQIPLVSFKNSKQAKSFLQQLEKYLKSPD